MRKRKIFGLLTVVLLAFLFIFAASSKMYGYTLLHEFSLSGGDGHTPNGTLLKDGTTLYGMTSSGGAEGSGTIFKIKTNGSGYQLLHSFSAGMDGGSPHGSLILSGSNLYGMTNTGGIHGGGTIFQIKTDGSNFQVLHYFAGGADDGWGPEDSLTIGGTTLYGTTLKGGDNGVGTVFKIETDGSGFTLLYEFERGIFGHNTPTLYQPIIHVPLIILQPEQQKRQDVFTSTSSVDVLPTLLKISGKEIPDWIEGEILPPYSDTDPDQNRSIYALEAKKSEKFGVLNPATVTQISGKHKLIYTFGYDEQNGMGPMFELFDLENDPEELENLYSLKPGIASEMESMLLKKIQDVNEPYRE